MEINKICPCCGENRSEPGKENFKRCDTPYKKEPTSDDLSDNFEKVRSLLISESFEFIDKTIITNDAISSILYIGYKSATGKTQEEINELKKNLLDEQWLNENFSRAIENMKYQIENIKRKQNE